MFRLVLILLLKALILAFIIGISGIGLSPDEAQYWTWSQKLSWGFYSKPPAVAWQIWLTTAIFGDTVFGVRFGALVIGFFLSLAVYKVARSANLSKETSFWAGIIAAFSPLGVYLSFVATTDGGAILFLTLAAAAVVKGANREKGPNYLRVGRYVFVGALFKWTAFIFWPIVLCYLFFFKNLRKWSLVFGILFSLLALLPSLHWNMSHEWATFRHVSRAVVKSDIGNFVDFLASQIGLLSPVFFVLLIVAYFFLRQTNRGLLFAAGFPLLALIYLVGSLFKKMQPNWVLYAYPAGLPLVAWVACDKLKKGKIWLHLGTWLSILIVAMMFAIPSLQATGKINLPYKVNPFRHSVGWENLASALTQAGYKPNEDFLFADKYQATSLLSFYGPKQKRAYFFNISHTRKNQFSFWPQMEEKEAGKRGYFVVLENMPESSIPWYKPHYLERLKPYFEKVNYCGAYPLYTVAGKPVKYALIFEGIHYNGTSPPPAHEY